MKCEEARALIPLFLYGELSFDQEEQFETHIASCQDCHRALAREKVLHSILDGGRPEVTPELLQQSRQELHGRVYMQPKAASAWSRLGELFHVRWHLPAPLQPVGALALIAMGFFGARFVPQAGTLGNTGSTLADLGPARVRWVESEPAGKVRIVVEETREKTLSGTLEDARIQKLLMQAAKDPADAGLRVESMDLLKTRPESAEVRSALTYALQHDPNPGVRLKALEGLKHSSDDPEVRRVVSQVLLNDKNAGVRMQAIDLLTGHKEDQRQDEIVGLLQELMRTEDNDYIRMRAQKTLHEMNASPGMF